MIELPEALVLAGQINKLVSGKRVAGLEVAHTPHKLVWYYGKPAEYSGLLVGRTIGRARAFGGFVEIEAGKATILLGEGVNIRFHASGEPRPEKHQLLFEFKDGSALSLSVQMYGGMGCFRTGELENKYYQAAREKPGPLSAGFGKAYFDRLIGDPKVKNLSLKAFLATEQRIPGLGNGVLQDILFEAKMHPKKKAGTLSRSDIRTLFAALKSTLKSMAAAGGRDTEPDLHGRPGGYKTRLSKNTVNKPCPVCRTAIRKETYLGGSIYYCPKCQKP
jgi:formamidopyrimidine-DNA glycosylase